MRTSILLILYLFWASLAFAQVPDTKAPVKFDPPKEIDGFEVRYATLSKGKYQEVFTNDTIQQIGSVYFNRVTGEVVGEVEKDSLYFPADVSSRWWSVDPLAHKLPEQSPYNFVNNNPIYYVDPDGRAAVGCCVDPVLLKIAATVAPPAVRATNKRADAMVQALNRIQPGGATVFDKISAYTNAYLDLGVANYTDLNDISVLWYGTHMDSKKATREDRIAAAGGLVIPFMSGAGIKALFRGTSLGFEGNRASKLIPNTSTSSDPLVATVFALESKNSGQGVLHIALPNDLKGISLNEGNVRASLEAEIPLSIAPKEFAERASVTVTADQARGILSNMGFNLPAKIRDTSHSTSILESMPKLNQSQIQTFYNEVIKLNK